ncbi:hemerythrin domain-containing protein [Paraburkholderia sp. SARCC-3016]|jgi:hemerythrin superfamily protein|uniref:hemerythrin domain-containing protein n=1 Tax=Paraburkholderia sp. SARCC-3016 TaxID=3058611 RepID=UPI00280851E5|nr:hemerythrin domain-containing protein [Paraburkholderia sp. SARCC-3016]MDQ7978868.1 hemerythrin domain-containing protein [Paraburkholderia sp. SARCC-3016]
MTDFSSASPTITSMIRMDHTHVLCAFHRYRLSSPWWRKRAIVGSVCTALEIHAQLEEEIFYPAVARIAPDNDAVKKSEPEHDEMREIIAQLRSMGPENAAYDGLFMQLMRVTIHHVADEETVLIPIAERSLKNELSSLGAAMTRRRMQLLGERPVDVAVHTAGTFPVATAVLAGLAIFSVSGLFGGPSARRRARSRNYA